MSLLFNFNCFDGCLDWNLACLHNEFIIVQKVERMEQVNTLKVKKIEQVKTFFKMAEIDLGSIEIMTKEQNALWSSTEFNFSTFWIVIPLK